MSMYCKYCFTEENKKLYTNTAYLGLKVITIGCNYCSQRVRYKNDTTIDMIQNLQKAIRQWNIQQFLPKDKRHLP